jgi:hypothetical protein
MSCLDQLHSSAGFSFAPIRQLLLVLMSVDMLSLPEKLRQRSTQRLHCSSLHRKELRFTASLTTSATASHSGPAKASAVAPRRTQVLAHRRINRLQPRQVVNHSATMRLASTNCLVLHARPLNGAQGPARLSVHLAPQHRPQRPRPSPGPLT